MKFEVGQDRIEVHFLAAYSDALVFPAQLGKLLNTRCPEFIIRVYNKKYTILYSVDGLNRLYSHIESRLIKRPDLFYRKVKNGFKNNYKKAIALLKKSSKDNLVNFEDILESIRLVSFYLPVLRYFEVVAIRRLKESLNKNKTKLSDNELFKLTFVDNYTSLVAKENIDLLKIALRFYNISNPKEILKHLKNHTKKFSYFELHASTKSLLTEKDFEKRLKEFFKLPKKELINKLRDLQNNNKNLKQEKQKIRMKYRFNNFEKQIIKILELSSEIKVKITDWVCLLNYLIVVSAKLLSKNWGIKEEEFYLLLPQEIIKFSRTQADRKILDQLNQRRYAVIWHRDGKLDKFLGEKAKRFLKRKITEEEIKADEISGAPIFKGKLRGVVKIVRNTKDFPKVKKGDILVSSDTTPDFVPVFKKVSGIITDEGGVICHAAIVAREMKIPCVVGTKVATKILKDNDTIELDAGSGVIKILNKRKK